MRRRHCFVLFAAVMMLFAAALVGAAIAETRFEPKLRMCAESVVRRSWPRQVCHVLRVHDVVNASGLVLSPALFLNCSTSRSPERWAVSFTQLFSIDDELSEETRARALATRMRVASLAMVNAGFRDADKSTDPTSDSWETQGIFDSPTDLRSLYDNEKCDEIATAIGAVFGVCGAGAIVTCLTGLVCFTGSGGPGGGGGGAAVGAGDDGVGRAGARARAPVVMADVSDAGRRCRCGASASLTAMICPRCDAVLIDGVRANAFRFVSTGHNNKNDDDNDDDDNDEASDGSDAEESGKLCPVCLEAFKGGEELVALPCAHVFHIECVAAWLESKVTCPTCQSPLAESAKRVEKALQDAPLEAPPAAAATRAKGKRSRGGRKHRRRRS